MYAVIKSGGKQHRVVEGETLLLEKLDVATGDNIEFEEVLMVGEGAEVKIGASGRGRQGDCRDYISWSWR